VADSLQRVPGISVDRTWGEGRDIFVRGADKNLNLTQLNGQAVASGYWWKNDSQSRGFNCDILASDWWAALTSTRAHRRTWTKVRSVAWST
jgi:iron complex outermembrane receptor protein